MPKLQTIASDPNVIKLIICDRVNIALEQRPELFRSGRGRGVDFTERYGLMRTVAHRMLTAETFVSHEILYRLAADCGVSVGWFFGEGEPVLPSPEQAASEVSIPIFLADGHFVTFPTKMLPHSNAADLLCVRIESLEYSKYVSPGDFVLVQKVTRPVTGAMHAILASPGTQSVSLVNITVPVKGAMITTEFPSTGQETFAEKDVAFYDGTEIEPPPNGILILGQLVGRLNFDAFGVRLNQVFD